MHLIDLNAIMAEVDDRENVVDTGNAGRPIERRDIVDDIVEILCGRIPDGDPVVARVRAEYLDVLLALEVLVEAGNQALRSEEFTPGRAFAEADALAADHLADDSVGWSGETGTLGSRGLTSGAGECDSSPGRAGVLMLLVSLLEVMVMLMVHRAVAVEAIDDKESVLVEVGHDVLVGCQECQTSGRVQRLATVPQILTERTEQLDPPVASVRDENLRSLRTDGDVPGIAELAGPGAFLAEFEEEIAAQIEHLDDRKGKKIDIRK